MSNAHGSVSWRMIARVAGISIAAVCMVIGVVLLINALELQSNNPLDHQQLAQLRSQLQTDPTNSQLQDEFRQLDAQLRGAYFQYQDNYRIGGILLLVGAIIALSAARLRQPEVRPPRLDELADNRPTPSQDARLSRLALIQGALAVGIVGVVFVAAFNRAPTETKEPQTEKPIAQSAKLDAATQWPTFRGHNASGHATDADAARYPTQWDAKTNTNIAWKTPIDLVGNNSPVIWGERVYLTGASDTQRKIYCFNATTGAKLWEHTIPKSPAPWPVEVMSDTGLAASTCATDGQHLAAIFPNGELIVLTTDGKLAWQKRLPLQDNMYGYASSLATHDGLLFVQWDHEDLAELTAFSFATGRVEWKATNRGHASWASPIVAKTGGRLQLITTANKATIAYDPATGKEMWRYEGPGGDVASTPVCNDKLVLIVYPEQEIFAFAADRNGTLKKADKLWFGEDGIPDITSPIIVNGVAYVLSTDGWLTGFDLDSGNMLHETDNAADADFNASPAAMGNLLHVTSLDGVTRIYDTTGDKPKLIATNKLDDRIKASPATVNGRIYMRGDKCLWCIAEAPTSEKGGGK